MWDRKAGGSNVSLLGRLWAGLLALGLAGATSPGAEALRSAQPAECMPGASDYTLLWWAHGWDKHAPLRPQLLCLQTGCYGLALDVEKLGLLHFGSIASPKPYEAVAREDHDFIARLPKGRLELIARVGEKAYRCTRAATNQRDSMNFPVRMIENGRCAQRFDVLQLQFTDATGASLAAEGRLEVVAWPDRLCLLVELTPSSDLADASLGISLAGEGKDTPAKTARSAGARWEAGKPQTVALVYEFHGANGVPAGCVSATDASRTNALLEVGFDEARGWHRIVLPAWRGAIAQDADRLDRCGLTLRNPADEERVARLLFDAAEAIPGITGFTPMIRDIQGNPTGIPVQLSKNWHRQADRRMLYEGPWFHGFASVRLPPRSELRCEFAVTWARWGGAPAASHAQLCLVGWSWNQLWDEAAIGSWGESICYEPDAIQRRCRIDDVRPLMVWGMDGGQTRWSWTHNVGGGDFLVYYNEKGEYVPLSSVKTAYRSHGPNLTDVVYSGISRDRHLTATFEVYLPRSDDLTRACHRFRYDILKPTRASRLAFYQLGADHYHGHRYGRLARGNVEGLIEEWTPERGGGKYSRAGIPCLGPTPWFSLHDAVPKDGGKPSTGAWATRGLVVREWKARLGGREAPPYASIYGTEDGNIPSASLELSAPPDAVELQPGDFVEATVELLVLPMAAEDYYGPNENLRASLRGNANTWRPVLRQADGNRLEIDASRGTLRSRLPLVVQVDADQGAEVRIAGGLGYVPVTFLGLARPTPGSLSLEVDGKARTVDQSVHGNDFWQTDYDPVTKSWAVTYNVPLDSPGDARRTVTLQFSGR